MDSFRFGRDRARQITAFDSIGAKVAHIIQHASFSVAMIHLEPHGRLGKHAAVEDQIFLVVAGSGQAATGGANCNLSPGTGVLWRKGEEHETRAGEEGLTAVVIEGSGLAEAILPDFAPS